MSYADVSLVEVSKATETVNRTQDSKREYRKQRNVSAATAGASLGSALAAPAATRYVGRKLAEEGVTPTLSAVLRGLPKEKLLSRNRLKSLALPAAVAGVAGANAVRAQSELKNVREGQNHERKLELHNARGKRDKKALNAGVKSSAALGSATAAAMGHRAVRAGLPGGKITRAIGAGTLAITAPSAVKSVLGARKEQSKLSELRSS